MVFIQIFWIDWKKWSALYRRPAKYTTDTLNVNVILSSSITPSALTKDILSNIVGGLCIFGMRHFPVTDGSEKGIIKSDL